MASAMERLFKFGRKLKDLQHYCVPFTRSTFNPDHKQETAHEVSDSLILTSQKNGIRRIIFNNEKQRNTLSLTMLEALLAEISRDINNPELRVIILSGKGPVFSSGHNLKELTIKEGSDYHSLVFKKCSDIMLLIQSLPVPVIAQVNGLAAAAGCQLVASCDIAIASDKSTFSTPGVNFGLFCSTPGIAVARAVPRKVAMDMLCTGLPITAKEALQHGLISRMVPENILEAETAKIAEAICKKSHSVVALGKAFFYTQISTDTKTAYSQGVKVMVNNLAMKDGQEGIAAFTEKRLPVWSHTE